MRLNNPTQILTLIVLLVIWVSPGLLLAQQPVWRLANGTAGISIADIDIYYSNPDTIYAIGFSKPDPYTTGPGFLLSSDRGENWNIISGLATDVGALKVDPFNSKIIYVSHFGVDPGGNDVSMTTDGGQTWKHLFIGRDSPAPVVEIDPIDLRTVYVGVGPKFIRRSSDRGQTWERLTPPPAKFLTSLAITSSDNNILYAGFVTGVTKSTDRGNSWTNLPLGFDPLSVSSVAVDPRDPDVVYAGIFSFGATPGGVYKSMDGGLTWNEMNNGLNNSDWQIQIIAINPKNPKELFFGMGSVEDRILFRSTDAGNSWFEFYSGLPDSGGVRSMAIDTLNNRIYAGVGAWNGSGIYIHDLVTSVDNTKLRSPETFSLYQNYPNPFNATTTITFTILEKVFVYLDIYDISGKEVRMLVNEFKEPGIYKVEFNASGLPSGIYFYRLRAGAKTLVGRALLVK